jgi:hypothetical protein
MQFDRQHPLSRSGLEHLNVVDYFKRGIVPGVAWLDENGNNTNLSDRIASSKNKLEELLGELGQNDIKQRNDSVADILSRANGIVACTKCGVRAIERIRLYLGRKWLK